MTESDRIPAVLAYFGLGAAGDVAPAGFGISNHNYEVSTAEGDYVVKFLVNQTPESIAWGVWLERNKPDKVLGDRGLVRPANCYGFRDPIKIGIHHRPQSSQCSISRGFAS